MPDLEETEHESFRLPTNKDISIWRYMDLAKYLWMLTHRSLYFSRATLLGDPFEGSATKMMVVGREHIKANRATDPTLSAYKNMSDSMFDAMANMFRTMVRSYLVNCWHMNEHESAAMWKLYSSSNEAICILSTYRRLRLCVPKCVLVGEIDYINYETQQFSVENGFNFIMHKRLSFSHERELRAIFWEMDGSPEAAPYEPRIESNGLAIEVDLSQLIERVYVSPTAAPWFASLVETMTQKFGFEFPVSQSVLSAEPLY